MNFYSKRSSNCLFCNKACAPPQEKQESEAPQITQTPPSSEGQEEDGMQNEPGLEVDKAPKDCSCHKSPSVFLGTNSSWKWKENEGFHDNLKYAFLLRQLLDYPKTKCVQYLKQRCCKNEGEESTRDKQDGWFTVCETCSKLVEEGHETYHKIEELEGKLDELKKNLKEMLVSSHSEYLDNLSSNAEIESSDNGDETICSEVRSHFVPKEPVDQSIVKMEGDNAAPSEFDSNDDFMNNDDDDPMGDDSDTSEWAPSEPEDNEDVKPDLANLMSSKDPSCVSMQNEEETSVVATSIIDKPNQTAENDLIDSIPLSLRRTRRSRKSAHNLEEDLEEVAENVILDEDSDCGPKRKKKKRMMLSDTESEASMSEEESDKDNKAIDQFSCNICGVIYRTQHRAREHEELHKRDDIFKCNSCKFVCLTNRGLKIHTTKLHSTTSDPSEKPKVKKKFKREYIVTDKEDGEDFACSLCPVVYKTAHRLKEHEEVHEMENVLKCKVCNFVCLKNRGLKIHARKYHSQLLNWDEIFDEDAKSNEATSGTTEAEEASEAQYPCTICCAVYKTKHRLREHKRFHKMDDAVKCSECPYVCVTERQLFVHVNKHHSHKSDGSPSDSKAKTRNSAAPYHCVHCPAKYQTEHRYKQHSALHISDSSFTCETCGWVLATQEKLDFHMIFSHKKKRGKGLKGLRSKEGPFKCDHCPALYGTRHAFRDHVYANHKNKLLQCKECDRCFESKQLLDTHIKNKACETGDIAESEDELVDTKISYSCEQCSSKFKSPGKLRSHIAATHEKKTYPCSVCSAVFPTESRYKFHMSRLHDKIHNVCKICGYKAHGASHLRLHMQKHTKQKMYMCEICSKTFTSPTYLTGHKQKEHFQELGVKPIKCEECDVLLPSRAQLKYHNQKVHEKKFKYFCEICGKGFLFESGLKNHAQIHSTERNEVCQICGAAYVHNRVLMDHMKNHHPEVYAASKGKDPAQVSNSNSDNQGPFLCKFCNKEFSMRYHLHSHLKTHTEVYEKFKCGICGKGYSSVSGVKRHEESAHQTGSYHCQHCGKEFPCRDYVRYHVKNHCKKKEATAEKSEDHDDQELETKHEPLIVNKAGQLHVVAPSSATVAVSTSNEFLLPHQQSAAQTPSASSFSQQDSLMNDFANPFLRTYYQSNYK